MQTQSIPAEQRQSWKSIAMVWVGSMICVPCLMIGGVLTGGGLSITDMVLSVLLGYALICCYMILVGIQACDTGLNTSQLAAGALGEKGSRYVISVALAISCIGWFGIQAATCGASFATMICGMLGLGAPSATVVMISSIAWGIIMLVTACMGFKGLKWLNYLAVPLLLIVCIYGIVSSFAQNGMATINSYSPEVSAGLVFGINMVVASFALGGVIAGDYCRFAKCRKDVVKSSLIGVIPAGLFILMTGAILSIVTGQYDISSILTSIGAPLLGLIALVLATWTTNVTNAYSGGLALSTLVGTDEKKFKITTGIAGALGTILGAVGLLSRFADFLSLMSALIPPLAGVIVAHYWLVCRGKAENFSVRKGFALDGVLAFVVGALVACITGGAFAAFPFLAFLNHPFFVGPINGIVVSVVSYVIFHKVFSK